MGSMKLKEDEAIEHRFITKSLETAQTRIEGFHFDARKHVLEFDNVLNHQRQVIYSKRRKVLLGSIEEIKQMLMDFISVDDVSLKKNIDEKVSVEGEDAFFSSVRGLILQSIDFFWMDHLEMMDYLRGSVSLRAYGQRDPLVEYKREGLRLFKEMEESIKNSILGAIPNLHGEVKVEEVKNLTEGLEGENKKEDKNTPSLNKSEKVGRNDLCPCGSGKKWKKCGEINSEEHKTRTK
jgi:preprotein translocase subunit SecA